MNQYLKVGSAAGFYILLALGVWQKWWPASDLLTVIYAGMGGLGLLGSVHYGAKYLTYQGNPTQPPKEG